jgi:photosystem II stability/assembly factor-like uncharacterized protein
MFIWLARIVALRTCTHLFNVLVWLQALLVIAMLTACGGGGGGASPDPQLTITTQPADVHVTSGQTATFTVGVVGAVSYRWQIGNAGGWSDIPGATGATYTFTPSTADSGAQFRVIVSSTANAANALISSTATLTVDVAQIPIRIDVQPQLSGIAYEGELRTLSVTAEGTSPVYRWQRSDDHGATWTDITGADGPGYTLQLTLGDDGALVRVVVSNALGQQISGAVALAVQALPPSPLFTVTPLDITAPIGQPATFNAVAVGNPAPMLQWQTAFETGGPWTDIVGETGGTYTIAATTAADEGRLVRAVATNVNGSTFAAATLSVSATALAPGFSEQPADVTSSTGSSATFDAHAYGAPSVAYQWQVSTDGGTTFSNINGATARTYTIMQTSADDDGKVLRVVATNSLGSATSRAAQLAIIDPPSLNGFSEGERWRPGVTGAYFLALATGGHLRYQWQIGVTGNVSDVAGATAKDFILPASTPANFNQVCVTISNPAGSLQRCAPIAAITWRSLQTTPLTGPLYAIAKTGTSTAVAGGWDGAMLRTTDGGVTWSVVSEASWSQNPVTTIAMRGLNGIATAGYDTRFTADGGQHWYSGPQDSFAAEAAAYAPNGTLVKVGDSGVRLSSDDGMTWRNATVDAGFTGLWRVAFNSAGVGIAVGAGQGASNSGSTGAIVRSTDGGATWSTVLTTDSPVSAVAFASDSVVVCIDWHGNFWRSTDAGLTWTSQSSGTSLSFYAITFLNANVGLVQTASGKVLRTADAGLTWTEVGAAMSMEIITPLDENTVLAGGTSGTPMRSNDGGLSWTAQGSGDGPSLISGSFADGTTGVVVGSSGAIERTTDGGTTWNPVASGITSTLAEVRFGDTSHGLAVGYTGVVLSTSDAGASWQRAASPEPTFWDLLSVAYATPSVAFAGGTTGLWKSTDNGSTWQSAGNFGSFPGIYCVRFGDALHGLVAGQLRQLWRTADGGQTWSVVTTNFKGNNDQLDGILDMTFVTPTIVVGVTGESNIVRSTDAGATWQVIPSGMYDTLHVFFRDAQVGIVIGDGILRTTDGGQTWTRDPGALEQPWPGSATAIGDHSMIVLGASNLIYRNDSF